MPLGVNRRRVSASHYVEYVLLRLCVALFAWLPRGWALRLGAFVGSLLYYLALPLRKVGLEQLRWAFPQRSEAERRSILWESARNLGRMAAEVCHFPELTPQNVGQFVSFADRERWAAALASREGRGLIVLTAHFGNWELLAYAHGLLGFPVTVIHRAMRNPLVDRWLLQWRARGGTRSIAKKAAAREALKVLRAGGILAIPADQNQRYSFGVFVDFFGKPACTTTGPVRLAAHSGAMIVPVFLRRLGQSERHTVEVLPPIELVNTGDPAGDLVENTQRCAKVIEAMIREYPEQWIWFHRRWKTRPPERGDTRKLPRVDAFKLLEPPGDKVRFRDGLQ